jgi:FkbM family methyltransferase
MKAALTAMNVSAKFFVFEPQIEAASVMEESVMLNRWRDSMVVINAGAVNERTMNKLNGTLTMELVKGSSVHGIIENQDPFGTPAHELYKHISRATTIDREIDSLTESIDLLLVQTNGAEIAVLTGASEVFHKQKVKKLVLRLWVRAPYIDPVDGREYIGEDKWRLLEKLLNDYGCRDIMRTNPHASENTVTAFCT